MNSVTRDMQILLVRELQAFAREVEMFPDDASVWRMLPGVTNSAGTLALHVCGNLQHYVGHVLGGTNYVRHRELEFSQRAGTRAELVRAMHETVAVVEHVLPRVSEEMLSRDYPEQVGGCTINTRLFLSHLSVHLAYHLGQAGYVRRVVTGDSRSSGAIALKSLTVDPEAGRPSPG